MPEITANNCRFYYELDGPADACGEAGVLVLSNGIMMSTASLRLQTAG